MTTKINNQILKDVKDINNFSFIDSDNAIKKEREVLNTSENYIDEKVREYKLKLNKDVKLINTQAREEIKTQEDTQTDIRHKKRALSKYMDFLNFIPFESGFFNSINMSNIKDKLRFYDRGEVLNFITGNDYKFIVAYQTNNNNINKYSLYLTGCTDYDKLNIMHSMRNPFHQKKVYMSNRIKYLSEEYFNSSNDYLIKNFKTIDELKTYYKKNIDKIYNLVEKKINSVREIKNEFDFLINSNNDFKTYIKTQRIHNIINMYSLYRYEEFKTTSPDIYKELNKLLDDLNLKLNINGFNVSIFKKGNL